MKSEHFLTCPDPMSSYEQNLSITLNCSALDRETKHEVYFAAVTNITCHFRSNYRQHQKTLADAHEIVFLNCHLPSIPRTFFQRIGKTEHVYLNYSGIESISSNDFAENSNLKVLVMSHNNLIQLPSLLFVHTAEIQSLDFSYNQISKIDSKIFGGVAKKVKKLSFAHNLIELLENELFTDQIHLTEIDFSHNLLKSFNIELNNLESLKSLRLESNKIVQLDCGIFPNSMAETTSINLATNHLEGMDFNCDKSCESLVLNVDDNKLTGLTLPKSQIVESLTSLFANKNKIENISIESDMKKLKHLKLADNKLFNERAMDIFVHCSSLETLDLSSNTINQLSVHSLAKMKQLINLNLQNVSLAKIDCGTFAHPRSLVELNLSYNQLTEINFDLFVPTYENLTKIYLNDNRLADLVGWSNVIFPRLNILSISNNNFNCSYLGYFLMKYKSPKIHLQPGQASLSERINIQGISCFNNTSRSSTEKMNINKNHSNETKVDQESATEKESHKATLKPIEHIIKTVRYNDSNSTLHTIKEVLIILVCVACLTLIGFKFVQVTKKTYHLSMNMKTRSDTIYHQVDNDQSNIESVKTVDSNNKDSE